MTALAAVGTVATPRRERGAPMIRVEGLVKRFAVRRRMIDAVRDPRGTRWVTAVDHVSLAAGEGEILGLLGPNGAGKTTLVKILSTLVTPDAGVAEVGGFDVVREGARARHVLAPVTADERSLDWRLSATENLRFFGALHGLHGDALRTRAEAVLERVGLADAGRKLVGAFSSGMKQRLLIGRALLSRPRVLLLDEPTRSLDPLSARAFRTFLREEVVGREGCTILLATHDHEEALELCDRIAIMGRGRLLALDTPAAVAREFGESRYRAWTTAPEHAAFGRVVADGGAARVLAAREPDGTAVVDLALPPGVDDPTETLSALVFAGAPIARFERVQPTLADIMERVLHRHERGADA